MNSDERKQVYDRREVALDEKLRKLDLSTMNLVPPEVGICDPPLRVFPLNNEWAKIIMGLVSWLATIAPWRDAEDESYVGIQEVETFMIGCDPCEALLGCLQGIIDTPASDWSDVLEALYDILKKIQEKDGDTTVPILYEANPVVLDEGLGCNEGNLFAAVTGLVDLANAAIIDVLQKIDVYTDSIELVGKVISAIPILNQLPIDEIAEFAENFFDGLLTNYLAAYDEPLRTEYRCDLFCLAKADCYLDFQQVHDYFAGRSTLSIKTFDLQDVINFITQGAFSGQGWVHICHAFFFFVLAYGGDWDTWTADFLIKQTQTKFNDSDPDWAILCDCAPTPWTVRYDFENEDPKGWTVIEGRWLAPPSPYLYNPDPPENDPGHCVIVERYFSGFDGLTQFQFPNVIITTEGQHNINLHVLITHSGGQDEYAFLYTPGACNVYFDPPLDNVTYIQAVAREDYVGDGGSVRISGVVLVGASNDPPPEA